MLLDEIKTAAWNGSELEIETGPVLLCGSPDHAEIAEVSRRPALILSWGSGQDAESVALIMPASTAAWLALKGARIIESDTQREIRISPCSVQLTATQIETPACAKKLMTRLSGHLSAYRESSISKSSLRRAKIN